jgi:alpha-beta hydrolase superfamily lysophospholipase
MKSYTTDNAWQQLNKQLPAAFQLTDKNLPTEDSWNWKGNTVHLDRYVNTASVYRIFLHHGVGTNGRQLNMIFGHKMAALGYDVVAIDNLGYGMTQVNQPDVTYDDWVHLFADFVNEETIRNPKKIILYGLSAGGMLAYSAACYMKEVHGIIGMCFLKNTDKKVAHDTVKFPALNWLAVPLFKLLCNIGFKRMAIPVKAVSKMNCLVNDAATLKICLADSLSSGAKVQLQFLYGYISYQLPIAVEEFDKCPVLLTQPGADAWTPLNLSEISMKGIKATFTIKILKGGSHYPIEEKALVQLVNYADEFIKGL